MSRSLKSAKAFSRKVIPLGWRSIIINDINMLRYMGSTNLEAMLSEWKILNLAYTARMNFLKRYDGAYYSTHEVDETKRQLSDSVHAIKVISEILPEAEPKPLFALHRSMEDSYEPGDTVFIVLAEAGAFYPVIVTSHELDKVYVRFENLEGTPKGVVDYNSPLLLTPEELKYLAENPDYARLFACASGLAYPEDQELFLTMIEDCVNSEFNEIIGASLQRETAP